MKKSVSSFLSILVSVLFSCTTVNAQPSPTSVPALQKLAGMWSDAPGILGFACFGMCTDDAIDRLYELLDDPANDEQPFLELLTRSTEETVPPLFETALTDFSRDGFPVSDDDDLMFLECKPPGYATLITYPHQNEITLFQDRVEMRYGEWDAKRVIWMDGRVPSASQPHTLMGYSVGHMEGDILVVNTTHLTADRLYLVLHSDQLSGEERYYIEQDGELLFMDVTFTDPVALSQPITLKKIWGWAPDEEIFDADECEIPADYLKHLEATQ